MPAEVGEIVGEDAEGECCNQELQQAHQGGDASRHECELRHGGGAEGGRAEGGGVTIA